MGTEDESSGGEERSPFHQCRDLFRGGKKDAAWALVNGMLERAREAPEKADISLLHASLSFGSLDSKGNRALLERAGQAGVEPDVQAFNLCLSGLQIEGESREELDNLVDDMRARGLKPNEFTQKVLARREEVRDLHT